MKCVEKRRLKTRLFDHYQIFEHQMFKWIPIDSNNWIIIDLPINSVYRQTLYAWSSTILWALQSRIPQSTQYALIPDIHTPDHITKRGQKWHLKRYHMAPKTVPKSVPGNSIRLMSKRCRFGHRTSGHRKCRNFTKLSKKRRNRGQDLENGRIVVKTVNLVAKRRNWHLNRRFQDHRWGEAVKGKNSAFLPMFRA